MNAKGNNVWIGRQQDYELKALIEKLGKGLQETGILPQLSGQKVLIKPNLTVAEEPEKAITTHPLVVEALANIIAEAGAADITIAESSQVGTDTGEAVVKCGFSKLSEEYKFVNLEESAIESCSGVGPVLDTVKIFQPALEVDVIISVAKLKTTFSNQASLSCKNLKGVLPDREKKRFHEIGVKNAIPELLSVLPPVIGVVEGIEGLSLDVRHPSGLLFVGANPVCTDAVAAHAIGVDPREVAHLQELGRKGLGELDIEKINKLGLPLASLNVEPYQRVEGLSGVEGYYQAKIIDGNPCSGCTGAVISGLKSLSSQGVPLKGRVIAVGPELEEEDLTPDCFIVGNCARKYRHHGHFIPGCPSMGSLIVEALQGRKH